MFQDVSNFLNMNNFIGNTFHFVNSKAQTSQAKTASSLHVAIERLKQ